jgi:hypothetical protein
MTQQDLEQIVIELKGRIDAFERSDRFTFSKLLNFLDGRNIQIGRTTGTKIGTAADQKIGFFGHAPVVQQSNIPVPSGGATIDSEARTGIANLISTLRNIGINA